MNTALPPDEITDIEQLRQRLIVAERDLAHQDPPHRQARAGDRAVGPASLGRSSEAHPGQVELSLFNEAELAAMQAALEDDAETSDAPASDATADTDDVTEPEDDDKPSSPKPVKPRPRRVLPEHLERVQVTHELDEEHRRGECIGLLMPIGEEITEQIGVIPARQFVIQHIKFKYACSCRGIGAVFHRTPCRNRRISPGQCE